ncbi:hypothetical protein HPTD01_2112 [Halomonas sp. TD01]|nr:hypothetical protein GME_01012 [Halomonas sp. TD01]CAH1043634.1 hypothetical protein HPTD01_2112 [Halomonas sp. TD01]
MFLVIGAGEQFIHQWAVNQDHESFRAILAIIGVLLMMAILVKMIPDAVQGIINGASLGSATPSVSGMARAAGSVAVGAAVGAAGGAMAMREASKLAGEQLSGSGALAPAVALQVLEMGRFPCRALPRRRAVPLRAWATLERL